MLEFTSFEQLKKHVQQAKTLDGLTFENFKDVPLDLINLAFVDKDVDYNSEEDFLYFRNLYVKKNNHWKKLYYRWNYYKEVREILQNKFLVPSQILEAGPFGAPVVRHCDTIDIKSLWYYPNMSATYFHDLKNIPWPIEDNHYKFFIALRVFQHLHPYQKECVQESVRIAENLIFVIPDKTSDEKNRKPICQDSLVEWIGVQPSLQKKLNELGTLYYFKL